ncbi:MAG: hypothetical protein ACI4ES_08095 [Roseburia sp.]
MNKYQRRLITVQIVVGIITILAGIMTAILGIMSYAGKMDIGMAIVCLLFSMVLLCVDLFLMLLNLGRQNRKTVEKKG